MNESLHKFLMLSSTAFKIFYREMYLEKILFKERYPFKCKLYIQQVTFIIISRDKIILFSQDFHKCSEK